MLPTFHINANIQAKRVPEIALVLGFAIAVTGILFGNILAMGFGIAGIVIGVKTYKRR